MRDWLLSVIWYTSLLAIALSLLALLRPLLKLQLRLRRGPALALAAALLAVAFLIWLSPGDRTVASASTALDIAMPTYQFRELHTRSVDAAADKVRQAVKDVTAGEIFLFQLFTTIRRFGRSAPESILNAPSDQPILEVATKSGFILLAETDREVTLGAVVAARRELRRSAEGLNANWFNSLTVPGIAKAGMNFVIEPDGPHRTRLTTETRVFVTDRRTLQAFTAYWRTIFPGSWILRVTWLDAIARRAEATRGG
jgi:hypothetical protein